MFVRFFLTLLLLTATGYGQGRLFVIPQWGHGADTGGNTVTATASFINLANTTNRVTVSTFSDAGAPINLLERPGSPFQVASAVSLQGEEMAPFGFGSVSSFSENTAPGGIQTGWAVVESTVDMAVEVVFTISSTGSGQILTSTSVLPTAPTTAGSFIAFVGAGANTGVALLNPASVEGATPAGNGSDATIDLMVVDRLGHVVGGDSLVLGPGEKVATFLDQIVPGLNDFTGTFELRSDAPVVILPLRQEGIELTTQEVHPARDVME